MTSADFFAAGTRLIGLFLLQLGLSDFVRAGCRFFAIPFPAQYTIAEDLVAAVHLTVFGCVLLLGARAITRVVYGRPDSN